MLIRRIQKDDLALRVEWMNNPRVYSSMHFDVPVSLENTLAWYERIRGNDKRADVVFEEEGTTVAYGGLTGVDNNVKKAELYIFVNPFSQRGGLGTKATKLLCKYGFEELELNKIYLETNEDNFAARRVYEKCGFKLEGVLRNEYIAKDGIPMSRMYYGLLKGELYE